MAELPGEPIPMPKERGELDDAKHIGRKEILDRMSVRQQQSDVMFVLSSVEGRRFYWRLMKRCGIFKSSYSAEEGRIFFYEGERNIGLMLLKELNEVIPSAYLQMMEEDASNDKAKKA